MIKSEQKNFLGGEELAIYKNEKELVQKIFLGGAKNLKKKSARSSQKFFCSDNIEYLNSLNSDHAFKNVQKNFCTMILSGTYNQLQSQNIR